MKETRIIMGMPVTVEIVDPEADASDLEAAFSYFDEVDKRFSPYKSESEVSLINAGRIRGEEYSPEMKEILSLAEKTKEETSGYFNIHQPDGKLDPSGLVKGWAIKNAAELLKKNGWKNFYVEAGGDIQVSGKNAEGQSWSVGIRNPFKPDEIVKVVHLKDGEGMATSGTYARGAHIYNPLNPSEPLNEIVSLTVIGPDVYEADRFATAAFAMGRKGIEFIEKRPELEGYAIHRDGAAIITSAFNKFYQ